MWLAYALGVGTPFALALVISLLRWIIGMSLPAQIGHSECSFCAEAKYRFGREGFEIGERSRWYVAWDDFTHGEIIARLPRHRDAWQAHFDRRPTFRPSWYAKNQRKYGRPNR